VRVHGLYRMHPVHLRMQLYCLLAVHVHAMYGWLHGVHAMFRVHLLAVHSAYVQVPYDLHRVQSSADVWTDGRRQADIAIAGVGLAEIEGAIAARAEAS
jgi:hypothetical protein